MNEKVYEIQDLVDISGVPRRNIYFYVQQGLLPPPAGAGLAARYNEEHLLRLRLIPLLRARGLRLDQIREQFVAWSREDMEQAVSGAPVPHPKAPAPDWRREPAQSKATLLPVGQACLRFDLLEGLALIAPAALSSKQRRLVDRILQLVVEETAD